ncbi:hypothetical protein ACFWPA_11175 [Rhodococcus sp. NPDC058505]|uniref:hypothetical protein n=1 Tax=Rhodococcus sp. NPDC058505 TaxID=3346531 RepID=UPI00364EE1CC
MQHDAAAPAATRILDTLVHQLSPRTDDETQPNPHSSGHRAALVSARIFVLDECIRDSLLATVPDPTQTGGTVGTKTLRALDRIRDRLDNELGATSGHTEREAGYRAGISEALIRVREIRQDFTVGR